MTLNTPLPPPVAADSGYLRASATEMVAAYRTRRWSCRDVVEAHIRRILQVNPAINAVVECCFEDARNQARAADARYEDDDPDLPPLLGVPCTIKESFSVIGMRRTSGLLVRKDYVSDTDATAVARLKAAGTIILGTTNVSELLMWMESSNRVYGRTNNPYNPKRIVGGSSGGEGAVVGAGASPIGLGADIGGSIRLPAFFNGVFGHKPTGGLVPATGQYPIAENDALRYLASGPIARRATDLMPMVRVLAGPDGVDPSTRDRALGDPPSVDIADLEVTVVRGNGLRNVSADLLRAQSAAAAALARRGAAVRYTTIPEFKHSLDIWSQMLSAAEETTFRDMLREGRSESLTGAYAKLLLKRSPHMLPAMVLASAEKLPLVVPADTTPMVDYGRRLRDRLARKLGSNGVLLFPPYTRTAPRHRMPVLTPLDFTYTAIFNALELPVTMVPLGLDRHGLPLGVQVVAAHWYDHNAIACAVALETALGGWVPPWREPREAAWA